ncbi:hypothetical protein [Natronoarchaeum rubrum]|uniref:hypothetical protein n=1 Tax=Natronoarchaeum rubrum TaxID=755311 RepID=UPI0021124169|nr:hypothetical protein [Natronoarchaeum rubrum]
MSNLLSLELLVAAFAGGAFGAAIGALQSFVLAGFVVVLGELYALVHRTAGVDPLAVDLTGAVGFGVVLGPHVAFGGGAAAVAYAAQAGYLDADGESYPAKRITRGFGGRADVLAVGGAFGALGYAVASVSTALALPTDPVALGVVLSALTHRLAFGYSVVGAVATGRGRLRDRLDVRPDRTVDTEDTAASADGGRGVDVWLPYQCRSRDVTALGAVVGVLGGYLAYLTGSAFLAFGISVVGLVFLCAGVPEIPVTHHISLPASTGVLALAGAPSAGLAPEAVATAIPLWQALLAGAAFGVVGSLAGELSQRLLFAHAETHLDPPAASIVLTSLSIGLLAMAGVLDSAVWVPTP